MAINRVNTALLMILILILAACQQEAQVLPTLIPSPTVPEPTATPEATATPTNAPPTLPPTWTPTPTETYTPSPTDVIATSTPLDVPEQGLPPACETFAVNGGITQVQFPLGASPLVAWNPVDGAELYRVTLSDASGRILKDDIYIAETQYSFAPELFERDQVYGWTVIPLDAIGDQMCFPRGLELIPFVERRRSG